MDQKRVRYTSPGDVARELIVVLRAVPDMRQVRLPVAAGIEATVRFDARQQALVVIPIRRVNGDGTVSIALSREERSAAVTDFACRTFLQRGKAKHLAEGRVLT